MKNLKTATVLLAVLILSVCATTARAQETAITPEKRELVKELLELTVGPNNLNAMIDAFNRQQEQDMPKLIAQSIPGNKNLTARERAELELKLRESAVRANQRMKEVFKRINYEQMVFDLAANIFSKHFTEAELKEMLAFYRSPVGKKSVEQMPGMMSEMMEQIGQTLFPRIQEEMSKIIADEAKQFEEKTKPAPKSQPAKRQRKY